MADRLRLNQLLRSSSLRMVVVSWLLVSAVNASVILALYDFTLRALLGDLTEQIDHKIDQRLAAWPKQLPVHAGVTAWLYRQFAIELADLDDCVALVDSDGELELANIDLNSRPEFRYRRFFTAPYTGDRWQTEGSDRHDATCLVVERLLTDGGRLTYGVPFDTHLETIRELDQLRFWGLLVTIGLAGLISLALVRRLMSGLRAIHDTCQRVAAGDLSRRIPPFRGHRDLNEIANTINHMLDQTEQLTQGIRQVSDAIAHDLKTPLARLRGQLELLLQLPQRSDAAIEAVIAEADQVLGAFNALLRIAQLEQGSPRQAFIHFDFQTLLPTLRDLFEITFADKQIRFRVDAPAAPLPAFGDRELWLQALSNLLDNAYKYTPEGGEVVLALAHDEERITITVSDTGPGIPGGERDNVLKRFYRLDKHRSSKGLGLGLSLVAAVCKVHHAELLLEGRDDDRSGLVVRIGVALDRTAG
jgi:signal transduction histidine kinase